MKKNLLLVALLALTTGLCAQSNAPQAAPAAPAPAAAPAADPARLALAHEAIAAMHADKMFDNMAVQMKQMAAQLTPMPANATPEDRKKAEDLQGKIMDLSMAEAKGLIAKMDGIYAEVYTGAELKAMVAFFTSPEGQSMLAKQPQVMTHLMPMIQEMQRNMMPKVQKLVEEARGSK